MKTLLNFILSLFHSNTHQSNVVLETSQLNNFFKKALQADSFLNRKAISKDQLVGDLASQYNGLGMDYSESKLYTRGDDNRLINWKQTAKVGELITNKYYQESETIDYVLFDQRASMFYGTQVQIKLSIAIKTAICASIKSIKNHRKIVVISITDTISVSEPICSYDQALMFFTHIAMQNFPSDTKDNASISVLIKFLQALNPQYSVITMTSDFHDLNTADVLAIKSISSGNSIVLTQIQDKLEKKLPNISPINYYSLATKASITIFRHFQLKAINKEINAFNETLEKLLMSTGAQIYSYDNFVSDEQLLASVITK